MSGDDKPVSPADASIDPGMAAEERAEELDVAGELPATRPRHGRVLEEIFAAAIALEGLERERYISRACAGDAELRAQVWALVMNDGKSGDLLDRGSIPDRAVTALLEPGVEVFHYKLLAELGRGGMGLVFLAQDTRLDRRVAIKFLCVDNRELEERFLIEARATARCHHDHIVVIHEVGRYQERPYMVLEYLDGETLRQRLGRESLSPERALELIRPVVEALIYAHDQHIVHRDLKPENIMLTRDGRVKVLDFGIAKVRSGAEFLSTLGADLEAEEHAQPASPARATRPGARMGTMPYMSPEQWNTASVDQRSDIWAVGMILYEMLLGRHPLEPFSRASLEAIGDLDTPMPGAASTMPELGEVAQVIDQCLRKRPDERLPSARALRDRLARLHVREPAYPDEQTRRLGQELGDAYARKRTLEQLGESAAPALHEIVQEILRLKRALREGGRLKPGDVLGEERRFTLLRAIGQGGFGTVWEAHDHSADERVAVKVLHSNLAGDSIRRARFFRGARMMAELAHPNIVRIVEPHGEDQGFSYFAMELMAGGSLEHAVMSGALEAGRVVPLILGVGRALALAHARGWIHRDVKPQNILLTAAGEPRLTDFDLAVAPDTTGGTRTGAMGTFVYAAPELLDRPQDATPAADVYGLAMVAVFLLYRHKLPMNIIRDQKAFVRKLGCEKSLEDLLVRALDWDASRRFPDAGAFCEALEERQKIRHARPARTSRPVVDEAGRIEIVHGDITELAVDAIVSSADSGLLPWATGVAVAIFDAAGAGLLRECRTIPSVADGEAVITGGYSLPAKHVIHTVPPTLFDDTPRGKIASDATLSRCYRSCLRVLGEHGLTTLAFPALATGNRGFPRLRAAQIALASVRGILYREPTVEKVIFCCYTVEDLNIYNGLKKLSLHAFWVSGGALELVCIAETFENVGDFLSHVRAAFDTQYHFPAYTYGVVWVLRNADTGEFLESKRILENLPGGHPTRDRRSLAEAGIQPGSHWLVERLE